MSLSSAGRSVFLSLALASWALASSITIDPIMVGTGTDRLATDLLFANAIYAQVPLSVLAEPERLITAIDGTSLTSGLDMQATSTDDNLGLFLADASWEEAPDITVWYVNHIYTDGGLQARGVTFVDLIDGELRFGVGIALSQAVNDTLAHELAHMLTWYIYEDTFYFTCADPAVVWGATPSGCMAAQPDHDANPDNLMAAGSIRHYASFINQIQDQGGTRDQITASQAGFMLLHTDFVIPDAADIPEPASVLLLSSGAIFVCLIRRRRAAHVRMGPWRTMQASLPLPSKLHSKSSSA